MKTELNKKQVEEKILEFFSDVDKKTPEEIRKMKRLAMHYSIKLGGRRKLFCKYCYSNKLKVKSIKRGMKSVICENCGKIMRWKIGI
jgi:RNase P subunit RPR2